MWAFWVLGTLPLVLAAWKPRSPHLHGRQAQTRVQMGGTTIIGTHIQSSNVDFYGGNILSFSVHLSSSRIAFRHPFC